MKRNHRSYKLLLKAIGDSNNEDDMDLSLSSMPTPMPSSLKLTSKTTKPECDNNDEVLFLPSPLPSFLISTSKTNERECEDLADTNSPVASPFSPLTHNICASRVMEQNNKKMDDIDSPVAPLYSPLTPNVCASRVMPPNNKKMDDINSPVAPLYSPLTPNICASRVMQPNNKKMDDIDSPVAPLYSPLTPVVAASRVIERKNSSPLPPMSPETFSLFETLNQTFPTIEDFEHDETSKDNKNDTRMETVETDLSKNYEDQNIYCGDNKCVLNNNKDSDGKSLKRCYVPESDSDSDDGIVSTSVQTNVTVHYSEHQQAKSINKILNTYDSSIRQEKDLDNKRKYLDKNNEELMDAIEVKESNSDNRNKTNEDEDLTDFSCDKDADYVPDSENEYDAESDSIIRNYETVDEDVDLEIRNQNECETGRPRKGRKRKYPDHTIAQKKEMRYKNLPYNTTRKRMKSKVFHDYACKCLKQCFVLVSREKRQEEFEKYVLLGSYESQLLFLLNNVKESPKTRSYTFTKNKKTGKKKPRSYRRNYFICDVEVCKDMFLNNFQISSKKVDVSLKKKRSGNPINDQRGKAQGGWNKTADEDVEYIKKIINSLPTYESHYRREQTDCKYLKIGMTVKKIYDIYIEELKKENPNKKPVSIETLKRIFYKYFNLRCKSLKKDTCNRCDALTHKIKNCESVDEKLKLKEEKDEHLKLAENQRKQMNADLMRAKTDKLFECLTFDLEKTLPLPRIPTNIVFYKRQLWLYNSGIHVGSSDIGYCNVWLEGEAGRGSQEVGSCLVHYIKKHLTEDVEDLVLWSDSCGGQNRNIKIVTMLKAVLNGHPTLKTITLKFLEPGHSFLPNDTDFSKIEYQLKYHERIYTAEQYINVMKTCKKQKPLRVYRMQKQDFISVRKIEKKIVNRKTFETKEKVNWLKTKEILLKNEAEHYIYMKSADGPFFELNIGKKVKGQYLSITEEDFVLLWPNGKEIAQAKLDDITSMFDLIPKDCIEFYKSLKGNVNAIDDVDGFGGEIDFETQLDDDSSQ